MARHVIRRTQTLTVDTDDWGLLPGEIETGWTEDKILELAAKCYDWPEGNVDDYEVIETLPDVERDRAQDWEDLREQIQRGYNTLIGEAREASGKGNHFHAMRLLYKASGMSIALDYMRGYK